jgi:hypothetical protein
MLLSQCIVTCCGRQGTVTLCKKLNTYLYQYWLASKEAQKIEQLIATATVFKSGNTSLVVVIPQEVCEELNLKNKSKLAVLKDKKANRVIYETLREGDNIE